MAALKDIARGSPFADWKYFIRGLAAYYRQDAAETRANWERLDPARFAARIAAPLAALADPASNGRGDPHLAGAMGKLEMEILGGPILTRLHELQAHVAAGRWKEALRGLRRSRETFRKSDSDLWQRIGLAIYPSIVRRGMESRLAELTSLMAPPRIDPRWNRARAMVCELSREAGMEEAETHWLRYIEGLAELPCLTPQERTLAQALVWLRVGRNCVHASEPTPTFFGLPEEHIEQMRARAVEYLTKSVRLAPNLRAAYESLAEAHVAWKQSEQAAETYRRLLGHFPEDFEALRFLAVEHQRRDEPFEAREYALRARRLKPLDRTVEDLVWSVHVASARHYALNNEWDRGRAEFEAAEEIIPQNTEPYHLLVCKAAFEFKAGELGLGHRLVDGARTEAGEETVVLLDLFIQAIRYALPKVVAAEFEHRWITALKKKCSSRAAGGMCKILTAYLLTEIDYSDRAEHVGRLLGYLRRCSRVKWQAEDLRNVCGFLDAVYSSDELCDELSDKDDDEFWDLDELVDELLEKFVRKGRKAFPEQPYFQYLTGELEIRKGPIECNRPYARHCFQRALEFAKNLAAEDGEVVEGAKRRITFLEEMGLDADAEYAGPPPPHFFDDGDGPFFDEDDEFCSDDDVPSPNVSPRTLFGMFTAACESMGLDPEDVLDRTANGMPLPLRVRAGKAGSRSKRKKKR